MTSSEVLTDETIIIIATTHTKKKSTLILTPAFNGRTVRDILSEHMGAPVTMIDIHDCSWNCDYDTVLDTKFIYNGPQFNDCGHTSICVHDIQIASLISSAGGLLVHTSLTT